MGRGWGLRIRTIVDGYHVAIILLLLLVALGGGYLAYDEHTNPETVTEEYVVDTWSEEGAFEYSATVLEPNEVYPEGEILTGQPAYYSAISPIVDGEFEYYYDATGTGTVDVTTQVDLILRSADEDAVYWSVEESLGSAEETGVSPNEAQGVQFSIDIPSIENRTDAIEESLGASPGTTEVLVSATVSIDGTVNGEPVSGNESYDLTIIPDGATYAVENPDPETAQYEMTETETVVLDPDPRQVYGFAGLAIIALVGAVAIGLGRRYDAIAPTELELRQAERARERAEFDDWISTGRLPERFTDRPQIEMTSLEDIVDVAIDSDRRVIETPGTDAYYVIDGDLLYVYEPEPLPIPETGDESGLEAGDDGDGDGDSRRGSMQFISDLRGGTPESEGKPADDAGGNVDTDREDDSNRT